MDTKDSLNCSNVLLFLWGVCFGMVAGAAVFLLGMKLALMG